MSYQNNPRRGDRYHNAVPKPQVSSEQVGRIIVGADDDSAKELVRTADEVGKWLKEMDFSTSQIRNIFGIVRSIEQRVSASRSLTQETDMLIPLVEYRELMMLKPKLAYQHGRSGGDSKKTAREAIGFLRDILGEAIDHVGRDRSRFTHFVEFFEAILAYHRAYGGKN